MIELLARYFIKGRGDGSAPGLRAAYGTLCCCVGIGFNLLLFALKYLAGTISGSIAITADAFNNLSDAGSSVITLLGFKLAGKKPDHGHPFGHGRLEYVSGLIVSGLILLMGFELARSSFQKILHPEPAEFSALVFVILAISILVKLYMFLYNRRFGKKFDSPGMRATAMDSISDAVSTTVVLIASLITRFTGLSIDGWCGMLVALFILYTGYSTARDTVSPLLGRPPEQEFIDQIESIVMSFDGIIGIHDVIVHDYGPGRRMISLHAEVPGDGEIFALHDAVDLAEHAISRRLGCDACIHMDPIDTKNPELAPLREKVAEMVAGIYPDATIHDFRMVPGKTHTNLIFDAVIPYSVTATDAEVKEKIGSLVSEKWSDYFCVISIDRPYV